MQAGESCAGVGGKDGGATHSLAVEVLDRASDAIDVLLSYPPSLQREMMKGQGFSRGFFLFFFLMMAT
jgi:hypothetical protein